MATAEQVRANRENAKRSTGPRSGTDRTRFNGLKHGLRADQVVLPGESREDFEAELKAWLDDWRPCTHTRAVLVERAAVASWKLRRATRCEAAHLHDAAADVIHDFALGHKEIVEGSLHALPGDPRAALAQLRSDARGLDCLIGLWDGLAAAIESGAWASREEHHDRLLNLLGYAAGADTTGLEAARASLVLLAAREPGSAAAPAPAEVAGAAATLRAVCAERSGEYRRERAPYWDPAEYRRHLIDLAIAPTTKEAQLMHRYERAHEKALYAAIRGLLTLEKSGADLPEPPEPEPEACPTVAAEAVATPAQEKPDSTSELPSTCGKLASVGAAGPAGLQTGRSGVPAGSPGHPGRSTGADPGPSPAPKRR